MKVKEYLKDHILLFDGGMGTYFSELSHAVGAGCELANLSRPELITRIHREYLESGAKAVKTNTFGVNRIAFQGDEELVERTLRAGFMLAREAALPKEAFIFADMGPIAGLTESGSGFEEYRFLVDIFLDLGAENFLFETNSDVSGLREIAEYIKNKAPEAFVLVSFAVQPDGFSRDGLRAEDMLKALKASASVDALGLNCVCGAGHMLKLIRSLDTEGMTLSLMPNAGYPVVINNRTFYEGDPVYFAQQMLELAGIGAKILGGCCGTTPVHIRETVKLLSEKKIVPVTEKSVGKAKDPFTARLESPFWNRLVSGKKVVAVELDSPVDTDVSRFMSGAWELKNACADIITIADCPIARARMDSSIMACKIRRELQMDAMPHMTCRDRNVNATRALLLGSYAEGIRNVLVVTGDPIPTAERDEVKSVYQFNSRKMAAFISGLEQEVLPDKLHVFGALDVNARNFDVQLRMAREKMEKGMIGFLTQPVLTEAAFENLKRARKELGGYILGGIIPVVSERNARFMDSEINGIKVDPRLFELYHGKTRAESEELAKDISIQVMEAIEPYVDGFYFITPFGRTGLITGILKAYKEKHGDA